MTNDTLRADLLQATGKPKSQMRLAAENWLAEQAARRSDAAAAQERENYRQRRAAEGKTVRPYKRHNHEPMRKFETYEAFQMRCHKDRQREYYQAKTALTRTRADLSMLTAAEKAERKRLQQNARKQKQRLRDKGLLPRPPKVPLDEEFFRSLIEELEKRL